MPDLLGRQHSVAFAQGAGTGQPIPTLAGAVQILFCAFSEYLCEDQMMKPHLTTQWNPDEVCDKTRAAAAEC